MRDPRWIYGLPLDLESLYERAKQKVPDSVCEGQLSATAISFIEEYEEPLDTILYVEMGYDVFDDDLKPTLVLILHREHYKYSKLKLEDENFLREELGIKEKGKWFRYVGAFGIEYLDDYKKRALTFGSIPSRGAESSSKEDGETCSNCGGSGRQPVKTLIEEEPEQNHRVFVSS
ncbi:hypothetical protein SCHPADRAFT_999415, partial [Schizopora paradoxa]